VDDDEQAAERAPAAPVQRRLELLMEANQAVLGELSLTAVLRRIVASARELVGARYAALAVLGPDGQLAQFVHMGMDEETVRRIGRLPRGHGLLRVLIEDPRPLRLARISDHPRSVGFPPHFPPMQTFLGVPVKVREVVHGNLYLTERVGGGEFTEEDETTLQAFALSAGIAIENARLYEESQRRRHWAEGVAGVSSVLLDPHQGDALGLVAETVLRLTDGDVVTVVVPDDQPATFVVRLARGAGAAEVTGRTYPAGRSIAARAIETGRAVQVADRQTDGRFAIPLKEVVDIGPALALPLHGSSRTYGVLVVGRRHGRPPFGPSDLTLGETFATQAALAMELAEARADQQRLVVLRDRERIAQDLHDHVIQRLFASGLMLDGLTGSQPPPVAARLTSVVDGLDATIRQLRTLIFRLQASSEDRTLRTVVLDVAEEAAQVLGFPPDVSFEGPVDTVADAQVVDDVAAVCREALANVGRHAHAHAVSVSVTASATRLSVLVVDQGSGPGTAPAGRGLEDLRQRALRYGGSFGLVGGPTGGTELQWSVPLT
jgi:two-component system, NarL family, sensor histidine kinase DevS